MVNVDRAVKIGSLVSKSSPTEGRIDVNKSRWPLHHASGRCATIILQLVALDWIFCVRTLN